MKNTRKPYQPDPEDFFPEQHYSFISPELPKELMDECIGIVEKLDKRKNSLDVVNWKERAEMDQVTKRSGQYLTLDEGEQDYSDKKPTNEEMIARKKSTAPATPKVKVSKKEQELMNILGGVMDILGDE
jgi:hypothetical protein